MHEIDDHLITTAADLRARFPDINPLAVQKQHTRLNRHDRAFIARAPFCLLATSDGDGHLDVSPRGDPAGFVTVLDDETIAIPDRPGNNRLDSLTNILADPGVGLLFLIPGFDDTLRINGRACITTAPSLLAGMAVRERAPTLAIVITIEEVFLHCAKALRRSALWSPDSIQDRSALPSLGAMVLEAAGGQPAAPNAVAEADAAVETAYREKMY
ncbi:MAG: pyridoxamine 5'-phosphate oxidase family protein [Pseudomonadota bacterium]